MFQNFKILKFQQIKAPRNLEETFRDNNTFMVFRFPEVISKNKLSLRQIKSKIKTNFKRISQNEQNQHRHR